MGKTMQLKDDMLRVGVVASTHGVHGEVKVFPTTDDVKRFSLLKKVYLNYVPKGMTKSPEAECMELEVTGVKYFKQFAILKFKEFDNLNDVEKYKGMELYVAREDAVPLEEGEYYIADLIGLKAIEDESGEEIGVLKDVLQTGANDVYIIKGNETYKKKEILVPVTDECVKEINLDDGIVKIHLFEGLLDL